MLRPFAHPEYRLGQVYGHPARAVRSWQARARPPGPCSQKEETGEATYMFSIKIEMLFLYFGIKYFL
jgi:hypothetical protein